MVGSAGQSFDREERVCSSLAPSVKELAALKKARSVDEEELEGERTNCMCVWPMPKLHSSRPTGIIQCEYGYDMNYILICDMGTTLYLLCMIGLDGDENRVTNVRGKEGNHSISLSCPL